MWPSLSTGAINRILSDENIPSPTFQILGCRKVPGTGNDRYRLLISDGVTGCPFAMLGLQLSHMVTNKELEKFTIVRVDKWVCNRVQADRTIIILLNLTVLVPGNEVNEKIGNPIYSPTENAPIVNGEVQQDSGYGVLTNLTDDFNKMQPKLTLGAMNRILNGENVPAPILQILGCKKIPGTGNDWYRLLISDGVIGCPFAMLGSQLSHMVTNNELQKFTIIRVDKLVCNQVQADRKVIILLNLTVLVPGNKLNEKLGNPINSSTGNAPTTGNALATLELTAPTAGSELTVNGRAQQDSDYREPEMNGSARDVYPISSVNFRKMWQSLSTGAMNRILNGEHVPSPTLQILDCKKIPGKGSNRYKLLISDGVTCCPFGMLASQLSYMVTNKELKKFTIVRVDKCLCNHVQARKVIYLLKLTVLVPGSEVNEQLGNLINSSTNNPKCTKYLKYC